MINASFATQKWIPCGKQLWQCKFATQVRLEQLAPAWRRLIIVANRWLMLGLPHKSEFRVANSCGSAKFATRAGLEQLELAWRMLIMVANLGLMLDLPHK